MRVLICGGRSFDDLPLLDRTLDELHAERPITTVIHGGAAGADAMAHFWAGAAGVSVDVYLARWKEHGKAAGPIRNQRMLDEGKPDLVVAFPGGAGTEEHVLWCARLLSDIPLVSISASEFHVFCRRMTRPSRPTISSTTSHQSRKSTISQEVIWKSSTNPRGVRQVQQDQP